MDRLVLRRLFARRVAVALLIGGLLGCLGATAQADSLRFPKTGSPAFLIDVHGGWSAHEDQFNGIQIFPGDRSTMIYLSLVRDAKYKDRPLMELALAIGKESNITSFPRQEAIVLSGRSGTAFFGEMKTANGTELDVKMVIVPLEPDLWATETLLTARSANAAQKSALGAAEHDVTLTGLK